jgi:hypothetical protein
VKLLVLVLSSDSDPYPAIEREIWGRHVGVRNSAPEPRVVFLRGTPVGDLTPSAQRLLSRLDSRWSFFNFLDGLAPRASGLLSSLPELLAVRTTGLEAVFGVPSLLQEEQHLIRYNSPEHLMLAGWKTLMAIEWAISRGFTHVFRTNSSSFIDLVKLQVLAEGVGDSSPVVLGKLGSFLGFPFVSGAGVLLNRAAMEGLVEDRARWNHALLDDISMAQLVRTLPAVRVCSLDRLDLVSLNNLRATSDAKLRKHFHFRLKTLGHRHTVALGREFVERYENLGTARHDPIL